MDSLRNLKNKFDNLAPQTRNVIIWVALFAIVGVTLLVLVNAQANK